MFYKQKSSRNFSMLVIKFRASHTLGKSSATDLVPQQILFCMTLTQNQDWETEPRAWCILDSTNKIHFSTKKKVPEIYYCVYDILRTSFFQSQPKGITLSVYDFWIWLHIAKDAMLLFCCYTSRGIFPVWFKAHLPFMFLWGEEMQIHASFRHLCWII